MKNLYLPLCLLTLFSCGTSKLTIEGVTEQINEAKELQEEARLASIEAANQRDALTQDYKEREIKVIDGRIKDIDKQIKKINKSSKNSENETATKSLGAAVEALETEKKGLEAKKSKIQKIKQFDVSEIKQNIDSSSSLIQTSLDNLNESMKELNY